jgi:hypothetical protein
MWLLVGCSRNYPLPKELGPPLPVQGKVLLGDKPLRGGIVRFYPLDYSEDVCLTQGFIDTHGNYFLTCWHPYKETGALAGRYRVAVEPASDDPPQDGLVQGRYRSKELSPLLVTVQKDAPAGAYDLKLDVSKKR